MDTAGGPPDIVENLCPPGKGPLRVDDPLGVPNRRQVTPERGGSWRWRYAEKKFSVWAANAFFR